jgi:pimeloyl-ACP methyl ester carboxylesterase
MGRSARPPAPYTPTIEAQRDRVVALLDRLGFDRFSPVGHSIGGALALAIAHRHPDRVERAVVLDPPCRANMRCRVMALPGAGRILTVLASIGDGHWLLRRVLRAVRRDAFSDDVVAGYAAAFAERERIAWLGDLCRAYFSDEYRRMARSWERITAELLVVWGERDAWIPVADGRALAQRVPRARLVTVAGAGHAPHQERPDLVNRLLIDHLRGHARG